MKKFCVLAAICIVGVCSLPTTNDSSYDPNIVKCANELNLDLPKVIKSLEDTNKPTDDFYCLSACAFRESSKAKGSTKTQYEELMDFIKFADKEYGIKNETYTREQLESKLTECNSKGLNECDFLKCIKFFEFPFMDFSVRYG